MNEKSDVKEIDILQLASTVLRKWWIVAVATVLAGVLTFAYTYVYIKPKYKASALFYVNNTSMSTISSKITFSASDLTAAKSLVDTYSVILSSRLCLEEVIEKGGYDYTYSGLAGMINASAVNETEIFSVTVTALSPQEASSVANTIAAVLPEKIATVMDGASVKVVDYAVVPTTRSSPSYRGNTVKGMLVGAIIAIAAIILAEILNDSVKNDTWLANTFGDEIPLLAVVPHASSSGKYGKYGGYGRYGRYGRYGKYGKYAGYYGTTDTKNKSDNG